MFYQAMYLNTILVIFGLFGCNGDLTRPQLNLPDSKNSLKFPPCRACKLLVESFEKGVTRTARGKHDGGDASWEEQKLRAYKTSEIRLVEIQDGLCKELASSEDQCHNLAEEQEQIIEDWWFNHQTTNPDLYTYLCIEQTKVCCPVNKFGPNCDTCTNCYGNGLCKGNGTRKGNGKCACEIGYRGENCNQCDIAYYEAFKDDEKLLCSPCHIACDVGGCNTAGPRGCRVCKIGWLMETNIGGCVDIDECSSKKPVCRTDQFCVNSEGSFKCLECDKSCNGCVGDGPDLCNKCAEGFDIRDGLCTDLTNEKRDQYVNFTRYLTYLGLCIATCVIFQSSTWVASLVGLAVALYISVSEYWLKTSPSPSEHPSHHMPQIPAELL